MSHQKIAISQIEHTPQLIIRQTLHSIFIKMHKPASFGIKQFYTFPIGGNPELTIGRGCDMRNIIRCNAGRILAVMLVAMPFFCLIIEGIETIILGSNPDNRFLGIINHTVQLTAGYALSVSLLVIGKEAITIKPIQAFFGSKPKKAIFILRYAYNIIAR